MILYQNLALHLLSNVKYNPPGLVKFKKPNLGRVKGDFTYHKNEKKSQIDLVLTNKSGRNDMTSFQIIDCDWHISDHKLIFLDIHVDSTVSSNAILVTAENLNYEYSPNEIKIQRLQLRNYR